MRKSLYSLFCLLLFLLQSCTVDYFEDNKSEIVVEGWIEDNKPPIVILSKTLTLSDEYQSLTDLRDYIVTWAKVSVSDGVDTVVLTGKYDPEYFPPYIYTTGRMFGRVGATYTLKVEYDDYYATAETRILPSPVVEDMRVVRSEDSDSLYQIEITIKDENIETDYYQVFTKTGASSKQYFASYLGYFTDEVLADGTFIPVFRGKSAMDEEYTPYFKENDSVSVKISHIDEGAYGFWSAYSKNVDMPSNMFLTAVSRVPSNINGGLGYWCGMGSLRKNIVISEHLMNGNGSK